MFVFVLFQNLLGHPLCMALVRYKWNSFGKYIYFITLFLFVLFVIFLTEFLVSSPAPYTAEQLWDLCKFQTRPGGHNITLADKQ